MSSSIDTKKISVTLFDRYETQKNSFQKQLKNIEKRDFFDMEYSQWKQLSNSGPADGGFASRLTPRHPLVWRALLPKDFIVDAYGNDQVHRLSDILRNVNDLTWYNIPLGNQVLIQKYIIAIMELRKSGKDIGRIIPKHKAITTTSSVSNPIPIETQVKNTSFEHLPLPNATNVENDESISQSTESYIPDADVLDAIINDAYADDIQPSTKKARKIANKK